jgi:Domain of unknown function (DUF222)
MCDTVDDAGVVDAITAAARAQHSVCARELAAIGELYARRAPDDDAEKFCWAVDGHENVVAEVAAALRVSRGRAGARLRYAIALRERLPRVAEVFARGDIDFRLMAALVSHRVGRRCRVDRQDRCNGGPACADVDAAVGAENR